MWSEGLLYQQSTRYEWQKLSSPYSPGWGSLNKISLIMVLSSEGSWWQSSGFSKLDTSKVERTCRTIQWWFCGNSSKRSQRHEMNIYPQLYLSIRKSQMLKLDFLQRLFLIYPSWSHWKLSWKHGQRIILLNLLYLPLSTLKKVNKNLNWDGS